MEWWSLLDVGLAVVVGAIVWRQLAPFADLAFITRDPSRWPRLAALERAPWRLRTKAHERAAAELRALGFVELAPKQESTPLWRTASRTFYSAERATYGYLFHARAPVVGFITDFDDGTIVHTGVAERPPKRYAELLDQGLPGSIGERLAIHDRTIASWCAAAEPAVRAPRGEGTIEERLDLSRRYYRARFAEGGMTVSDVLAGEPSTRQSPTPSRTDAFAVLRRTYDRLGMLMTFAVVGMSVQVVIFALERWQQGLAGHAMPWGLTASVYTWLWFLLRSYRVRQAQQLIAETVDRSWPIIAALDHVPRALERGRARSAARELARLGFEPIGALAIQAAKVRITGRVLRSPRDGSYAFLYTALGKPHVELWSRLGDGTIVRTGALYAPVAARSPGIVDQGVARSPRRRIDAHARLVEQTAASRHAPATVAAQPGGAYRGREVPSGIETFVEMAREYYRLVPPPDAAEAAPAAPPRARVEVLEAEPEPGTEPVEQGRASAPPAVKRRA